MQRIIMLLILVVLIGCAKTVEDTIQVQMEENKMKITSPEFNNNGNLPPEYTCDGKRISPELNIEGIPAEAKSLALISDDPDAPSGDFVHWVVWNIPADTTNIERGKNPGMEGMNSGGGFGYFPPCPPTGVHRYFFKLYALDSELDLATTTGKNALLAAMEGHILDKAELIGKYTREK